ncbi:hypothetical protein CHUAL_007602 [Chamberlinius hualienensis]
MVAYAEVKIVFFCWLFSVLVVDVKSSIANGVFTPVLSQLKLNIGILEVFNSITIQNCAAKCLQHQLAAAFNFNKNGTCELIAKQENLTESDFTINIDFNYYPLQNLNPCKSNPCLYGGLCTLTEDHIDYKCNCPFPTSGDNCEELSCGTVCFRHVDMVFFAYNKSVIWNEAYTHCNNLGMTMAMMKDAETHQTIKTFFLKEYANRPNAPESFWIGLNRTSMNSTWKWVDGTPLGSYKGWAKSRPQDVNCGNIPNGGQFSFDWDDDPCDAYPGWSYYAFCQKQYPFFEL